MSEIVDDNVVEARDNKEHAAQQGSSTLVLSLAKLELYAMPAERERRVRQLIEPTTLPGAVLPPAALPGAASSSSAIIPRELVVEEPGGRSVALPPKLGAKQACFNVVNKDPFLLSLRTPGMAAQRWW